MTHPNEPAFEASTVPETPQSVSAPVDELTRAAASSFRAYAEAALGNGDILNKMGDDWFVSIGELGRTFYENFDTPENMRTIEHEDLMAVLGLEFFQKIVSRIREMENAMEDPWDEYSPTMTLKILYGDGSVSARDIQVYDDDSAKERLPETDGINFQIQPPREWFWRNVPLASRPADYLTRK